MSSISQVTVDRAKTVELLKLEGGTTSQWLNAAQYRSCFCVAKQSTPATWTIEGLLPDGQTIVLASYANELFDPSRPRFVTVTAMCGLPIRFVASTPQVNPQLWVILKS